MLQQQLQHLPLLLPLLLTTTVYYCYDVAEAQGFCTEVLKALQTTGNHLHKNCR